MERENWADVFIADIENSVEGCCTYGTIYYKGSQIRDFLEDDNSSLSLTLDDGSEVVLTRKQLFAEIAEGHFTYEENEDDDYDDEDEDDWDEEDDDEDDDDEDDDEDCDD